MIRDAGEYAAHLREAAPGEEPAPAIEGLAGRILRGRRPGDFERLSDDPARRLVFFLRGDGLTRMLECRGRERLVAIGYPADYIEHLLARGHDFRLVVFPEGPETAVPATWENVVEQVARTYPGVAGKVRAQLPALGRMSYRAIQRAAPWNMGAVFRRGRGDPRFMTAARLEASEGRLFEVRAFLFHEVHLNEFFRGDGFTDDGSGGRGLAEAIGPNRKVASLPDNRLVELPVE